MALHDGTNLIKCGGPTLGIDQSSAAAELAGAMQVVHAAAIVGIAFDLYIDNLSVQRSVAKIMRGDFMLPRQYFGPYQRVRMHASSLSGCRVCWVPSHGKKPEWTPATEHIADAVRSLNDSADEAAGEIAKPLAEERKMHLLNERQADNWIAKSLHYLTVAEGLYRMRADI